ncbi:type II toxin-antitoxin system ParD family antitoxin [Martelella mediterranea]|uniref:Antitoxin ParD1/3/4 n=1 Tax=Martelella mediterranea TaxID=293089 RepID=A0A4R3NE24_9HYPH|nr:type II toxin-antitoxin system ParD family antitoxin [Martelella mediterranea]TCT27721.1 antitoxin ParD1/3/4 [Martelella mediterranea]
MVEKISITLPPNMLDAIKAQVASGHFSSTSEVLREAMRLWLKTEEEREERLKAIRARVAQSIDDPRPPVPAKEAFGRIRKNLMDRHSDQ